MAAPCLSPEYEATLRAAFAKPYAEAYLIGAISVALEGDDMIALARSRAMMAVYDDAKKPDAYGRTGEKSDCGVCGTSGTEYGETCVTCGGFGWVKS